MVKTKEQLKSIRKARRTRLAADTKSLKTRKNWYPISDTKKHFVRKTTTPKAQRPRKALSAGQVLILLSGRFRGRRVVFLKSLKSGLLLVTGPYKVNGVPLKRVNRAYVAPTTTKVNLSNIAHLDSVTDAFFKKVDAGKDKKEKSAQFFDDPKVKRVFLF